MIRADYKVRMAQLRVTSIKVIEEIRKRFGENIAKSEFSSFINTGDSSPKAERIRKETDIILTEWENANVSE